MGNKQADIASILIIESIETGCKRSATGFVCDALKPKVMALVVNFHNFNSNNQNIIHVVK